MRSAPLFMILLQLQLILVDPRPCHGDKVRNSRAFPRKSSGPGAGYHATITTPFALSDCVYLMLLVYLGFLSPGPDWLRRVGIVNIG